MRNGRGWLVAAAVLAAGLGIWSATDQGRAADENKALKAEILKIADALEKKDPSAAKQASELAKKPGSDLDIVMDLFKPRAKGGMGVGDNPSGIKRDGIEIKIQDLDKKAPTAQEAKTESAALVRAAYVAAAIAETVQDKVPPEKKASLKQWQTLCKEMQKLSLEFAEAAKTKNPATIHTAAKNLNEACIKCHDVFR
jgi:hypothetical protein